MPKTLKLMWSILIIVLLNLFIITLVGKLSPAGDFVGAPPFFSFLSGGSGTVKTQARSDKTGKYGNADYTLLAKVISAEARGESYEGQVAVGAVILNRVEHPSFPNTISGVVYQPGAFTCMTDGNINQAVEDSAYRAAQDAINGWDPSGGAIYYYNPAKTKNQWIKSRPQVTTIGKHVFCK